MIDYGATVTMFCQVNDLPQPEPEYQFARGIKRKWRFDFAWPEHMLAVEVEGGVWTNGRHTRGAGFLGDCEKYNFATLNQWRVLRYTPQQLRAGDWITDVKVALAARERER